MLNWIVWNRTVYLYENGFGIKSPTKIDMPWNPNKQFASFMTQRMSSDKFHSLNNNFLNRNNLLRLSRKISDGEFKEAIENL